MNYNLRRPQNLFLCEGDLHGRVGRDLEALEGVSGSSGLDLVFELDEGDVVTARNKTDLLESGELKEKLNFFVTEMC